MNTESHVSYQVAERIATITIARPPVNALTLDLIEQIITALRRAGDDADARAVIIDSAFDKVFSAGLDLDVVAAGDGMVMRGFLEKLYMELFDVQYRLPKPSIAAVRGAARAGGMTLAVSCDLLIAGEDASFGYPEIDVGIIPALHFVHLPRQIGRHRAFELLFTGEKFSAAVARDLGLIAHVVPGGEVTAKAREIAGKFAAKSPEVMRLGRAAFMRANDLDYRRGFENMAEVLCNTVATDDAREGLAAFLEKRPPRWQE